MSNRASRFTVLALLVSFALTVLGACMPSDGPDDPKRRLSDYISRSFAVKSVADRKELLDYLTGKSKLRLSAWSDDQFREAFLESKREFIKLSFKELKKVSDDRVDITYELTYLDQGKGHDAKVTNKKLAEMIREQGQWVVGDVRNIKELVEYRDELSLP